MREPVAVSASHLSFRYGGMVHRHAGTALNDVSFRLTKGVTVVLGPNGAGKTTLIRLLATLEKPCHGTITYGRLRIGTSEQLEHIRALIGYLPQFFGVMDRETVQRNIMYAAWARGIDASHRDTAVRETIGQLGLDALADVRAGNLSGGQRQRLGLACATVHHPDVLILDEPTSGLDPVQRSEFRHLVAGLARSAIVVLSTHAVAEMAGLAAHVLVLNGGRLTFDGTESKFAGLAATRTAADPEKPDWEACYAKALDVTYEHQVKA